MSGPHAAAMDLVYLGLKRMFGPAYYVRQRKPFMLAGDVTPEPDLVVVRGVIRDFSESHPQTAHLIVEIADTSLIYDREVNGSLYAKAGIPEYWILNLNDQQLEIYSDPVADNSAKYDFSFNSYQRYEPHQSAAPMQRGARAVVIRDLLP